VNDLKRVSILGVLFLVILRISIGWQFLYEGLWKYNTLRSNTPWTADGYLKTAQGPFRDTFRAMTGDPDDLGWLNYQAMSDKWDRWAGRFTQHYGLNEQQQGRLRALLDPPAQFERAIGALPAGFDPKALPPVAKIEGNKIVVTGPITPLEMVQLEKSLGVQDQGGKSYAIVNEWGEVQRDADKNPIPVPKEITDFLANMEAVRKQANTLTFRQKLKGSLAVDPDRVGVVWDPKTRDLQYGPPQGDEGRNDIVRYGEIQEYKDTLAQYDKALKQAKIDFQLDHAERLGKLVAEKRAKLVGPIRAMESELKLEATKLLSGNQIARGAVPPENTPGYRASMQAMWGLLILGPLLILGLGTRLAALAGAVMVLSFYLVVPPWPGVPQPPGPEHSFVVNKNLIEVLALLAVAAFPTGTWFGIDGIFYRLFRRPTVETMKR